MTVTLIGHSRDQALELVTTMLRDFCFPALTPQQRTDVINYFLDFAKQSERLGLNVLFETFPNTDGSFKLTITGFSPNRRAGGNPNRVVKQ
jgi:hypothetical protein